MAFPRGESGRPNERNFTAQLLGGIIIRTGAVRRKLFFFRGVRSERDMIKLTPDQAASLKHWFVPERPGPLIGLHIILTGHGAFFVDRWPDPRCVLADAAGNYALVGDPHTLEAADLTQRIAGFVETPEPFVPLLRASFPDLKVWDRVIFSLDELPQFELPVKQPIRRLAAADADRLRELSPEIAWITKTWGSPLDLASSGFAWGAFAGERLVSVACTFFFGDQYEEIGVVTEPAFRRRGLSAACAAALCQEIYARGHRPSWTTSPDNVASLRAAEKLGFKMQRRDKLYVVGIPIPMP